MSNEKKKHGGARAGAGRKPESRDQITIKALLTALDQRSNGQRYEELLVEDFIDARQRQDTQLVLKYHNLILNKVMNTLARVEVTDSTDAVAVKQAAFAAAIQQIVNSKLEKE